MKNNIIFISSVVSEDLFTYIFETAKDKSGNAIQKFHSLFLKGLASHKKNTVYTLSTLPVSPSSHRKRLWFQKAERKDDVYFNYVPIINFPGVKNVLVFFYSFFRVLFWRFPNHDNNFAICDVLKTTVGLAAFLACKFRGIKLIAIVTDMPGLDVFGSSLIKSLSVKLIKLMLVNYDGYILITKQMNRVINPSNRPHIVMEGLVDISMDSVENLLENKANERILIYAGGIYERYGIKNLIDAFMRLRDANLRLFIYGSGDMAEDMNQFTEMDKRIKYWGVVNNDEVVVTQLKATLLVNPRPSIEEFTIYSFPSKNMEYMVSGTPLVTTKLPGMPDEYLPFVYVFEDESSDGIYKTLSKLLDKPDEELHCFGNKAKGFVLSEKNNAIQAERVTMFLEGVK